MTTAGALTPLGVEVARRPARRLARIYWRRRPMPVFLQWRILAQASSTGCVRRQVAVQRLHTMGGDLRQAVARHVASSSFRFSGRFDRLRVRQMTTTFRIRYGAAAFAGDEASSFLESGRRDEFDLR